MSRVLRRLPTNRDQIVGMLQSARDAGVLEPKEWRLLDGVLQVPTQLVREVMVSRSSMVVIEQDSPIEKIVESLIESRHSRFPVVGENLDDIRGLLLAKDLLPGLAKNEDVRISELLRDAPKVPESKRLDALLDEFRDTRCHMAIVLDEYGGTSGLVTIEDVLEQIVGNIIDEHDEQEDEEIQSLADGSSLVDAAIALDDLRKDMGIDLVPGEEYDTLGGFLLSRFGRVPAVGETLVNDHRTYEIVDANARNIQSVRIHQSAPDAVQ